MVITETIISNGDTLQPDMYTIKSIDVSKEFNKIPSAEIKLYDGSIANPEFKTLDEKSFSPGKKIEIFLKKEGEPDTEEKIFEGIVVNQEIERSMYHSILTIELCDVAVKMTSPRNSKVYKGQTDRKIIEYLVEKYDESSVKETTPTDLAHAQMVQYYVSDWDFMLSRAEANGQLVTVDNGEISVVKPKIQSTVAPFLTFTFGHNLANFDLKLNSHNQYQEVTSFGLDTKNESLTLTHPKEGKSNALEIIDKNILDVSSAIGPEKANIVHAVPTHPSELKFWSNAQIIKSRLSLIQGTIKIEGNGKIKVGQTLEIQDISSFNGKHIISGVRQVYTKGGGWYTYIQIGMDAAWFTSKSDVIDTQAAGLLPGVNGLQVGTVMGHKEDLNHEFSVLVSIPAFDQGSIPTEVYAMYTSLDAGADHGIFFPPKKGDRVVVGFLNDDPRQAIILGAMHSNKQPNTVRKKNTYRGIFTKSNYQLLFDEKKEMVTLSTADKNNANENKICIDQKQKRINLEDAHGNKIELHKDGITIISSKDFQIDAAGDLNINAKGKVKIKGEKVDLI